MTTEWLPENDADREQVHYCAATREACQPEGNGEPCSCACHDERAARKDG